MKHPASRLLCTLTLVWLSAAPFSAPTNAADLAAVSARDSGTIEGRVLNGRSGEYVENARLTFEGTTLETFTDADGYFRLTQVPAGAVRVRVFFTGLPPLVSDVRVGAAQTVALDLTLAEAAPRGAPGRDETVTLAEFVVGASREMDAAAIAINEQRFSANIKQVVSTDEFGHVAEGNVGEFLKFLPGVTVEYGGGYARGISLDGVPSANVPITIDGFNLAST